jgi:hypothetical protein
MILRWLAIFSRAAVSMPASWVSREVSAFLRLLADGIAIFEEADLVDLGQRVGHGVGQLVELVGADPHSTALYFLVSSEPLAKFNGE